MANREYQRLTRARLRSAFAVAVTSRSSIWLGSDHLLVVDTSGYTETYKRFYFRDIQAITITLSKRRLVWNWVFGVLTAFSAVIWALYVATAQSPGIWQAAFLVCNLVVFVVPLVLNNLLGPTCTCYLRTAVQTEEAVSVNRVRQARRILDRIRPLIIAAQGNFPSTMVSAPLAEPVEASVVTSAVSGTEPQPDDVPPRTL